MTCRRDVKQTIYLCSYIFLFLLLRVLGAPLLIFINPPSPRSLLLPFLFFFISLTFLLLLFFSSSSPCFSLPYHYTLPIPSSPLLLPLKLFFFPPPILLHFSLLFALFFSSFTAYSFWQLSSSPILSLELSPSPSMTTPSQPYVLSNKERARTMNQITQATSAAGYWQILTF